MKVIGHRGASGLAPENTYAGFDIALGLGVDGIETDVQKTKDGVLVLFHDDRLDKTTNGTGVLQELRWNELQELDAGSWFDDKYAGERIPLLREALERYGRRTTLDLEIKQMGIEYEVLNMVEQLELLDRVAFTSRDFPTVVRIKEKNPRAQAEYLTADVSEENLARVVAANIKYFCPRAQKVTKQFVDQWHSLGLFVRACGVQNLEMMRNAIQAGVDGMTFDYPDALLRELGRI
ncbi:MAG TPA: glycerophosphodiester phosphodiesterase family protein [Ktedonobacteraceae bacterium]|nr:glycerophosphodiester phosphodiesterase family protein [Ktedonobacteraceae bacterium]